MSTFNKYTCFWLCLFVGGGCHQELMENQPRYDPLEASTFFVDGTSARALLPGTVARGHLRIDSHLYQGKVDGKLVETLPLPVTDQFVSRGKERFEIFCAPCHDRTGNGRGMVVQRGFPQPPSFHIDRLRKAPVGHFFDVITNGFGRMPDHADQIPAEDRWAIIAYVRALQLSQHAEVKTLPDEDRRQLQDQPE